MVLSQVIGPKKCLLNIIYVRIFFSVVTSQLISLHDHTAYNSMEIAWNSEPVTVTYLPPYMLAFTEHTVEIRMASNGSLMQTINVPDLKLLSSKVSVGGS